MTNLGSPMLLMGLVASGLWAVQIPVLQLESTFMAKCKTNGMRHTGNRPTWLRLSVGLSGLLLAALMLPGAAGAGPVAERQATGVSLALPVSTELEARVGDRRLAVRIDPVPSAWEMLAGWPEVKDRGVFAAEGPAGPALQFATGYAIYDGIDPLGSGADWTMAGWIRTEEPDWGIWQQPWSSTRDPKNMFFFARPVVMHLGTFLTRAWELRLCRNRLQVQVGDWIAAGSTRLRVGQWTHVALVRRGAEIELYVNGQREPLGQPERVDGATGALLPPSPEPLSPFSSARPVVHPSDAPGREGRYPVLVLGHAHDSGGYQDKFTGAVGGLVLENRPWSAAEAAAAWERDREAAAKLSRRYSVLIDPVGGRSRRPDRQEESAEGYMQRMEWFRKARYGLFMHWDPSSVAGVEISWGRGPDPGQLPAADYDALYKRFNPTLFNPDSWAAEAAAGGMLYSVLTVKHHDGFLMWPSSTSTYTIAATPYGKDITGEYVEAFRKAGLRVGLYYSPRDWWWEANRPELVGPEETRVQLVPYVAAHLKELCTRYGRLDDLWFDGGVGGEAEMYRTIIGPLQPTVLTNDRNGPGDYVTPEGQCPARPLLNPDGTDVIWESCIPMGNGGWSYHHDEARPYDELIREMVEVFAKGGNLLRNLGPRPTGEWSPPVRERIKEVGVWLRANGESVYGTHRTRLGCQPWGWTTASDTTLYLHVFRWPGQSLTLTGLYDRARLAQLLATGTTLRFVQRDDELTLSLPAAAPDPVDTVIAVRVSPPR